MTDKIQVYGVDSTVVAMTKQDFFALAEKRIRDNVGSGDAHMNMDFDDYFTTPANVANEITLDARARMVNGIEYFAPQITLTLPAASDVETLVSNQTLIMFETKVVNVSASDVFYAGADGDSTPITWSSLTYLQQTEYMQDFKNNVYNDNDELKQYVFNHVVTNLAQDYTKGDSQAIIDAGYTQGVVGDTYVQWTKTDVEAVPLCKIQRRNQGAYHPVYNPNGCATFLKNTGDNAITLWFTSESKKPSNVADCFSYGDPASNTVGNIAPFVADPFRGDIAGGATFAGRSDGKFYDAIYASDVDDLRMSSRRVPWSQIREEGKRKAIDGELRGFEGVPFTKVFPSVGAVEPGYTIVNQDNPTAVVAQKPQLHSQANPAWTDIIGDPANIAATFPNGVEGQWIPQIPTGTQQEWKYTRKAFGLTSSDSVLYTANDGVSWNTTLRQNWNDTTNSQKTTNISGTQVRLLYYETQAHFTENTIIKEELDLGGVWAGMWNDVLNGALIASTLIGRIPTNNTTSSGVQTNVNLTSWSTSSNGKIQGGWGGDSLPTHPTIPFGNPDNNSPAVKTLDYLSETNGVAEFVMAYKELIYDGAWGDDNQFQIADNQESFTDDNGNTGLRGTAKTKLQYFIDRSA